MNNELLARFFDKTFQVLFKERITSFAHSENLMVRNFVYVWMERSKHYPSKSGSPYQDRVKFWFNGGRLNALLVDKRCFSTRTVTLSNINFITDKTAKVTVKERFSSGRIAETVETIDIATIIPIFPSYYAGNVSDLIRDLSDISMFNRETIDDIDGRVADICSAEQTQNTNINSDNFTINGTTKTNTQESNTMSKLNKAASTVLATGKSSVTLAASITAGNATNAVVKAALRPTLEPALRKMLQPKGFVQRTLGKAKVEDSVSAVMDSPLMDVLSAAILVSITSSGMVTNQKLVKGAALASDAAALKLFSLIDFDTLVSGLTTKIGSIVANLDAVDSDTAE